MSRFRSIAAVSVVLLICAAAHANSTELLTFEGLKDLSSVGNFYNGSGPNGTPNYGVSFSQNFYGITSFMNGGVGDFTPSPLGTPAIFLNGPTGAAVTGTMNVTSGFTGGINFFYTAGFAPGQMETVTIWSGAGGTGTVLATINLGNNNASCTSLAYCTWTLAGASFSGTAKSVTFTGPANELGLAMITLGQSTTAIPEPASVLLLGTGIAGAAFTRIRRRLGL